MLSPSRAPSAVFPCLLAVALCVPLTACDQPDTDADFRAGHGHGNGHAKGHHKGLANGCKLPEIAVDSQSLFPEGVTADPDNRVLYMGGMGDGSIMKVRPCKAEPEIVAPAGTFRNVVGVQWDVTRELLWVCNSDLSFSSPPTLDLLDPADGAVIASHDFGAVGFCNDVTFDAEDNIYATDSLGHRIVRVDAADASANTPVATWAAPPEFNAGADFGLNGITWDGEDRLYVANIPTGSIFAAEIDAQGNFAGVTEISLDSDPLVGPDGLYWLGDDTLLLVENGNHRVSRIHLDGDAGSLEVIEDEYDFPTTAAVLGHSAWVLEGELDHLFGFNPNPADLPFGLVRLPLHHH